MARMPQATTTNGSEACACRVRQLRIEDDGQGFDVEAAKAQATGKGLSSLEKRAHVLGGQLQISSSGRGSVVWLRVPFEGPRAS